MDRKKATDFPQELLDHFDKYVHGDISRREFLDRANKYAGWRHVGRGGIWESPSAGRIMLLRSRCPRTTIESKRDTKPCPRRKAMEALRDITRVRQNLPASCREYWSFTKTAA